MITVINGIRVQFSPETLVRCVACKDALLGDEDGADAEPP